MASWFSKSTPPADASKEAAKTLRNGVKVSRLLSEETILIAERSLDKNGLLRAAVERLCDKKGLADRAVLLEKVLEREKGISTTLDTGLSLPHARIDGLSEIVAAMALAPQGVCDPSHPEVAIRVMFLFFSPNKQESFPMHLQLLRGVSSLFQPALIDRLAKAASPSEALEILRAQEI